MVNGGKINLLLHFKRDSVGGKESHVASAKTYEQHKLFK